MKRWRISRENLKCVCKVGFRHLGLCPLLIVCLLATGMMLTLGVYWLDRIVPEWLPKVSGEPLGLLNWNWPAFIGVTACSGFAGIFCWTVLYSEILDALHGRTVSLRHSIAAAARCLPALLGWTALSCVIGLGFSMLEYESSALGRCVLSLARLIWTLAVVFVLPAIVTRPPEWNPFGYLKISVLLVKRLWVELLIGYVGILLMMAGGVLVTLMLVTVLGEWVRSIFGEPYSTGVTVGVLGLVMLLLVTVGFLLNNLYIASLYIYATEGALSNGTTEADMERAISAAK